jgi:hypothetical protein
MNRDSTAIVIAAGPSFSVEDIPTLDSLGDLLCINYASIPWRKAYPEIAPTYAFCGDYPRKVFPMEWLEDPSICKVFQMGYGAEAIARGWPNFETYKVESNDNWTANPFRFKTPSLAGPCNSLTLAYQWLVRQGYETIAFYGCDLKHAGTYAESEFRATEQAAKGKTKNHDKALTLLRWWSETRPEVRLVNLSPESALSDVFETLTLSAFASEPQGETGVSVPYEPAHAYQKLYELGYHDNENYSHAKRLAWYLTERLPQRNADFSSVLDVGCSRGWALRYFDSKGKKAIGADIASAAVKHNREDLFDCYEAPAHDLPLKAGSVDVYFSTDCLEHVPPDKLKQTTKEAFRVARKFVAVKVCPFEDRANWKNHAGGPLHLSVMPVQRWVDLFMSYAPEGSRIVWRESGCFVIEIGGGQ